MKRRIMIFGLFLILLMSVGIACADTGPKPVVSVTVTNLGSAKCYATLLCQREQFGPYCTTEVEKRWDSRAETSVWEAFSAYKDSDGFFFLQELWDLRTQPRFAWEYCPPSVFKVLLYWPEENRFAVSEITEAKDFYSLFTVDASAMTPAEGKSIARIKVESVDSSGYRNRAFFARVLITLAVELAIALCFVFRTKREWLVIIVTNVVTQIALGIFAVIAVVDGGMYTSYYVTLAFLEICVVVVEAVVYAAALRKMSGGKRGIPVYLAYAMVANAASYLFGLWVDGRLTESLRALSFMD